MDRAKVKRNSLSVFKTMEELSDFAADVIVQTARDAIEKRAQFTLGVSGGSIVNILAEKLSNNSNVEWEKWKVFLCDERYVPDSDPDSTYGRFKTKLIQQEKCESSWHPIDSSLQLNDCAADYEKKLRQTFTEGDFPAFDLLLLGMGPDGHTCSLFPGHSLLKEKQKWIAPINDSPKPPASRVTMTLPVLNNARNVAFICAGASKAEPLKSIFGGSEVGEALPSARVKPHSGTLFWIMDEAAASKL